jgi:hypothetical protein
MKKVEGMYDIEKITFTGFLAQDVETAAKKINYDFSGLDKSGEILGLRYAEFVVPLVKRQCRNYLQKIVNWNHASPNSKNSSPNKALC